MGFLSVYDASVYCAQHEAEVKALADYVRKTYENASFSTPHVRVIFEGGMTRITEHGLTKAQGMHATVAQISAYILQHYPQGYLCNSLPAVATPSCTRSTAKNSRSN